jgi:hypothetical protein
VQHLLPGSSEILLAMLVVAGFIAQSNVCRFPLPHHAR